jgi:hypothetical protein
VWGLFVLGRRIYFLFACGLYFLGEHLQNERVCYNFRLVCFCYIFCVVFGVDLGIKFCLGAGILLIGLFVIICRSSSVGQLKCPLR